MWCVPDAIAALTGRSREWAWLEVLADRQERGRRLTNIPGRVNEPHGGAHTAEALRVLAREGVVAVDMWQGTRRFAPVAFLRYAALQPPATYLVLQRGHMAVVSREARGRGRHHSLVLSQRFPIAKAWRIYQHPIDQPEPPERVSTPHILQDLRPVETPI